MALIKVDFDDFENQLQKISEQLTIFDKNFGKINILSENDWQPRKQKDAIATD